MVPRALFTGDEPLISVCVPLMELPDCLRILSSLVNVELAHSGGWRPLSRSHCRQGQWGGHGQVDVIDR